MIWELTNHIWQSTLFAAFAGFFAVTLRKNRAQVRYWLWFSASFKFFVPFSVLMSFGGHLEHMPAARNIATQITPSAVSFKMEQVAQPFSTNVPVTTQARNRVPVVILAVWMCGFAALSLLRFYEWLRIRTAVRTSTVLDFSTLVQVRSSPGVLEPGVVGWWKPILLLPEGIGDRLTPPQLEAVLAHELCHVRRRDNLLAAIHMVVEAGFWFYPLVWWIGARLVEERERACDEEVLRLGSEPGVYAEAILNICKLYVESPLACVSGVTGSNLKTRIELIMINRMVPGLNRMKKVLLAGAGIAALGGPVVIGLLVSVGHTPVIHAQSSTASPLKAQTSSAAPAAPITAASEETLRPTFDVASIKLNSACQGGRNSSQSGRLDMECYPVSGLILPAYVLFADGLNLDLARVPILGGPSWISSDRYDIHAIAEPGTTSIRMQGPLLRALLEDRFQLKLHRETRELPVFLLTVAKDGVKLQQAMKGSCTPVDFNHPPAELPANACGPERKKRMGSVLSIGAHEVPLSYLIAAQLSTFVDRPIIDRTGLTGLFDYHLEFGSDSIPGPQGVGGPATVTPDPGETSIFTALQKQLGLKLVSTKAPVGVLVIDHVERPSEN